jgi:hypothetical protein
MVDVHDIRPLPDGTPNPHLRVGQVAWLLGRDVRTVRTIAGLTPVRTLGGHRRYRLDQVRDLLARRPGLTQLDPDEIERRARTLAGLP